MSALPTASARRADISFAPHPLREGREPRAARPAGEAPAHASPASPLTIVGGLAIDIVAALSLGAFMAAVLIWACVFTGRV